MALLYTYVFLYAQFAFLLNNVDVIQGLIYTHNHEYRPLTLIQFKGIIIIIIRFTKKVTAQVLTMGRSRSGTHSSDVGQGDMSTGTGRVWLN